MVAQSQSQTKSNLMDENLSIFTCNRKIKLCFCANLYGIFNTKIIWSPHSFTILSLRARQLWMCGLRFSIFHDLLQSDTRFSKEQSSNRQAVIHFAQLVSHSWPASDDVFLRDGYNNVFYCTRRLSEPYTQWLSRSQETKGVLSSYCFAIKVTIL